MVNFQLYTCMEKTTVNELMDEHANLYCHHGRSGDGGWWLQTLSWVFAMLQHFRNILQNQNQIAFV